MATVDWPTSRAFRGAQFSLGLDVARSGAQGFYTGERQTVSHLADRLRGILTLPPCRGVDAGARESLLMGLLSTGDNIRMGMPHRMAPAGSLRGTLTAAASAVAGARSLSITGGRALGNLITNASFEIDSNSDGLADGCTSYTLGTTGTVTNSLTSASGVVHGGFAQRVAATGLGTAGGDRIGILREVTAAFAGRSVAVSAFITATAGVTVVVQADWYNGASYISSSTLSTVSSGSLARHELLATAPANTTGAGIFVWLQAMPVAGAAALTVDAMQVEFASAASTFAGYAALNGGDFLAVGGNLIQCAYAGATEDGNGNLTVPLTTPLQAAVTSGAAVTWSAPTGLWQLDADGMQLDYSAPVVQGGIAIPLRQVIA